MKYDCAIFEINTGRVRSVNPTRVNEDEARRTVALMNDGNLQSGLLSDWFEVGLIRPGDIVEINEARLDRLSSLPPSTHRTIDARNQRFLVTYYRRKADGVCVVCQSPNLETTIHCPVCARKCRERVARSSSVI